MRKPKLIIPVMFRHIGRPSAGISLRHVSWHTRPIYFGSVKKIPSLNTFSRVFSTSISFSLSAYDGRGGQSVKTRYHGTKKIPVCFRRRGGSRKGRKEERMSGLSWTDVAGQGSKRVGRSIRQISIPRRFRIQLSWTATGEGAEKGTARISRSGDIHRSELGAPSSFARSDLRMYVCIDIHTHI